MNVEMVQELTKYRGLLGMLAWRDIRVRYKQSVMGVAWAFFIPLVQAVVMWSIFKFGGMNMADRVPEMPYFLFVLSGVIPWTFFSSGVSMSIESLTRNSRLVTKIYFPREVFPLGSVTASLVDFSISLMVLIPVYVFFLITDTRVHANGHLFILPLILVIQMLLVAGLALILSMANLFFRDVKYIMTIVLQLWFFATNVMYPINFSHYPKLRWIPAFNPMIPVIDAYRDAMLGRGVQNVSGLCISAIVALIVFLGGWTIFHKAEFKFAEYV